MKVKLHTRMSGPDHNFEPGSIVDLPDDVAGHLVKTSQAANLEEYTDIAPRETAAKGKKGKKPVDAPQADDAEFTDTVNKGL